MTFSLFNEIDFRSKNIYYNHIRKRSFTNFLKGAFL